MNDKTKLVLAIVTGGTVLTALVAFVIPKLRLLSYFMEIEGFDDGVEFDYYE